jgi:L-ascorbate metabolism protein UlaG (beta-lactamase superfamily)
MQIQQIRNATVMLTYAGHRLLVDPMLCQAGALPPFKLRGEGRRRNPLVPLPPGAMGWMERATGVLLTHEHPDHMDPDALAWIKQRGLPVWASRMDVGNLRGKGLDARVLTSGALPGVSTEVVPAAHGRGLLGWLMGPVSGFVLAHDQEPSLYITGDSVWTPALAEALETFAPDVVLAPAGAANWGIGPSILFTPEELVTLARQAPGQVVFNHMEALDHCPLTRAELRARLEAEGLASRAHLPEDGEPLTFSRPAGERRGALPGGGTGPAPGWQKRITALWL